MRPELILLIGMPRSGTTWLGKIFDSHPDTLYRHEPDSVKRIDMPLLADVAHTDRYRDRLADFAEGLWGAWQSKVAATLPVFPKSYYGHSRLLPRKAVVLATKVASRLLGEVTVPEVAALPRAPRTVPVWKSIESLGRLGVMCRGLPACRAVLILRHPCAHVASVLRGEAKRKFTSRVASHEDFGLYAKLMDLPQAKAHGLTLEGIESLHPVERMAWRWVLFNEKAMDDTAGLPNCSRVRYEALCRDPMGEAGRLFDFSGLDWHEQTGTFIRDSTASERSSYYSIFKDPQRSANKWKSELSSRDIERVLRVVAGTAPGKVYAEAASAIPA
jgi:hypothetical protein